MAALSGSRGGPGERRPWGVLALILLLFVGGLELAGQLWASRRAPSEKQWASLLPVVSRLAEPGRDLVVVAPAWAEPLARHALGDAWFPLDHVARPDETRFERALVISALGARAPGLSQWPTTEEQRFGPFAVRVRSNPRATKPRYDFLERLLPGEVRVSSTYGGKRINCRYETGLRRSNGDLFGHPTFPSARFRCLEDKPWFFVGRTVIEDQHYRPRRCIWAHPSDHGPLTLRFPRVPIGQSLVGYGGLPYFFSRASRGAPIELQVLVAGQLAGSMTHADGEGWKRFELDTRRWQGQVLPVQFSISSRKATRREFCFRATLY